MGKGKPPKSICPTCGSSMMEHRHALNRGLVLVLKMLREAGRPVRLSTMELTRSQIDNAQKLKYWGLIEKHLAPGQTAESKGGVWRITDVGLQFITGRLRVPKYVWTFRGRPMRFEGNEVSAGDVDPQYRQRPDYAEDARRHMPPHDAARSQMRMFP